MRQVSFIMTHILETFLLSRGKGGCLQRRVLWIGFDVSIVFSADTAGRILDLDLDEETECEIRVFKSRVRKMVSEKNLKTPICSEA